LSRGGTRLRKPGCKSAEYGTTPLSKRIQELEEELNVPLFTRQEIALNPLMRVIFFIVKPVKYYAR
jgi:hypothetical protein